MKIEIDTRALQVMAEPGIGWIRVFGRGFTWKDTRRHALMFSERKGYRRRLEIGPWSFRWLKWIDTARPKSSAPGDILAFSGARGELLDGEARISSVTIGDRTYRIDPSVDADWETWVDANPGYVKALVEAPNSRGGIELWLTADALIGRIDPPDFFRRGSGGGASQ